MINRFVAIRGTAVRAASIKPQVEAMNFKCLRCSTIFSYGFIEGKFRYPDRCVQKLCKSNQFDPLPDTAVTTDLQIIKVQELADTNNDPGRVPRTIEVELTGDLVDRCVPGDVVTVCGVLKAERTKLARGKGTGQSSMYLGYIHANSLTSTKQGENSKIDLFQFSMKDLKAIQKILEAPDVFGLIVKSLCPSIYGNLMVKAGLALSLFGGTRKALDTSAKLAIRGDIHVLIVGDPGLGKSRLLQAVISLAPRGVYVTGSYSTSAGLTVTVARDPGTGDYSLEAGALVLGDQGICAIDEFDKMKSEHNSLLEAMEQQSVSVAKAGIVCTLPARTAVIAAANPVGGHYDKSRTISENLKISSPLLSRFDLIFILLDSPDRERDARLSEHVMRLHTRDPAQVEGNLSDLTLDDPDTPLDPSDLLARLQRTPAQPAAIPATLLRKFIGYAKRYCPPPKLTPEAAEELQDFYISLRRNQSTSDFTPITTRQLESLIRMAEARARLEMRPEVTRQDALVHEVRLRLCSLQDVISIMRSCLKEAFDDEFQSQATYSTVFAMSDLRLTAQEIGLQVDDFNDFLESISLEGYLLKKGGGFYQLQTV